jgi:ribosomal-protein-alanine N-acetyltransferase
MTQLVSIRKADPHEVDVLAEIGYRAWEQSLLPYFPDTAELRRNEEHRLRAAVRDNISRIIVGDSEAGPVGWCLRSGRRAYIPYLFVAPRHQNQGIGTTLLRRMESMLELEGADHVQLDTLADNVRAVRFYEHQGYQILALKPDGPPGRDLFMSVRLEKRLRPYRGPIKDEE